jgi:carbamoyltransferase
MYVLGMHASGPNTAACLVRDGEVIAFAEEERFTRVKLATNAIPSRSSAYCMRAAGITLAEVDAITVGWAMDKYPEQMAQFYAQAMQHPAKDVYSEIYEKISLNEKDPRFFGRRLEMAFRRNGYQGTFPKVCYKHHHLSHAYSVFYPSPFDEALILVIDGSGEEMATSLWLGRGEDITLLQHRDLPHSIGYFYAALTEYLGFSVFTGEGKVMGLAPYGKPNLALRQKLDQVMWFDGETYCVDPSYIYFDTRTHSFRHTDKLTRLLGRPPRIPESKLDDWHCELAWETQHKLERTVVRLLESATQRFGVRDICVAGGVAMNCKMNGLIATLEFVDRCFVIPASNDAGVALGSALLHLKGRPGVRERSQRMSVYSGPEFSDDEIEAVLKQAKIRSYRKLRENELYDTIARRLADGAIVGWFQGRMEVGARALGNRSILANPAYPDMKNKINAEVKHREPFRPFAPAILIEHAGKYFTIKNCQSYEPYHTWMLQAAQVLPDAKAQIPAVVHVDGSIRPQIVSQTSNPRFYALMSAFFRQSGIPVLLNTSFNVRGEPIICRPEEAVRCFYSTGLDMLVMGSIVLEK